MATVGELFHSLDRDEVIATIDRLYPTPPVDYPSYQGAWDIILRKEAAEPRNMVCEIYSAQSLDDPPEPYFSVHGVDLSDGTGYAIEFTPWNEWLTMEVRLPEECADMTPVEQLAHILWEMTWCGYNDEAVADEKQAIVDRVEEVKEMIETEAQTGLN